MAILPQPQNSTVAAIDRAMVEAADNGFRAHLGASLIGRPCERELWYHFRWALRPEFSGRMLRLFARGNREEDVMAQLLRHAAITVLTVDPNTGKQFRYATLGGHFGGSMDGALVGLLEAPKKWHVWECKTHNAKSFADLKKRGVRESKPEHWAQMQCYMHWGTLERAYYLAVNKDDDELHGERVEYDRIEALKLVAKAQRIIEAAAPPARISEDAAWYQCKLCRFHSVCHADQLPEVHCRTCVHATPELDGEGRWSCVRWQTPEIPVEGQKQGCDEHRYLPALVGYAKTIDGSATENWVEYEIADGRRFRNGAKGASSFPSVELRAISAGMIGDLFVENVRGELGAKVTG